MASNLRSYLITARKTVQSCSFINSWKWSESLWMIQMNKPCLNFSSLYQQLCRSITSTAFHSSTPSINLTNFSSTDPIVLSSSLFIVLSSMKRSYLSSKWGYNRQTLCHLLFCFCVPTSPSNFFPQFCQNLASLVKVFCPKISFSLEIPSSDISAASLLELFPKNLKNVDYLPGFPAVSAFFRAEIGKLICHQQSMTFSIQSNYDFIHVTRPKLITTYLEITQSQSSIISTLTELNSIPIIEPCLFDPFSTPIRPQSAQSINSLPSPPCSPSQSPSFKSNFSLTNHLFSSLPVLGIPTVSGLNDPGKQHYLKRIIEDCGERFFVVEKEG
ncbi:hypothetical protein GEMRC1_010733 [Eukaryota sp. GEM-RC1]